VNDGLKSEKAVWKKVNDSLHEKGSINRREICPDSKVDWVELQWKRWLQICMELSWRY